MTSLIFAAVLAASAGDKPLVCPMMGGETNAKSPAVEYAGMRIAFCCAGCDSSFAKNPTEAFKIAEKEGDMIALALFDPVSGTRVPFGEKTVTFDYKGVREVFASEANRATFVANPEKFFTIPAKESLNCPLTGEAVKSPSQAAGFKDIDGVRYYACCAGCVASVQALTAETVKASKAKVTVAKTVKAIDVSPEPCPDCKDGKACENCKDK